LPLMGPRTEVCGPAFAISEEEYEDRIHRWLSKDMTVEMIRDTIVVRLGDALNKMKLLAQDDRHTTAVIFYGSITISAYADAHTFVIYDSHGIGAPKGKSVLFMCDSTNDAKGIIRTIFNSVRSSAPLENYYNMCIFASPSYHKPDW